MTAGSSPTHRPPAKRREKPSSTTVASLGDDLLLEIFLRLPSLATLVRAALTCRGWRSVVASSPAFRRRFRELHPAPLLGLFVVTPGVIQEPTLPSFPSFVPARCRDRDLTAAVRGGDFFLTSLQDHPDLAHSSDIVDCRGGYVLVMNGDKKTLAVINPLARGSERFFDLGHEDTLQDSCRFPGCHNACLICSDEDPTSFRVVKIAHDESRVRATFFSSDTGEWSICPWVDLPVKPGRAQFCPHNGNLQANGSLYWVFENRKRMVKLDTATWQFSVAKVPRRLRNQDCTFAIGETKSGAPCIVYAVDFKVGLLLRRTDTDGVEKWMTDRVLPLLMDYNYDAVVVVAIRDGFAYLATLKIDSIFIPSLFFSLCLKTMKLEKLFERTWDTVEYPYFMTWPSSLVGNRGRFAPQDVTENA